MWAFVLAAAAGCFATKLAGYLVPRRWLEDRTVVETMSGTTIGVLAALVVLTTFVSGTVVAVDARLVALVVAIVALAARAPFIVVVLLGAVAAAVARLLGAL